MLAKGRAEAAGGETGDGPEAARNRARGRRCRWPGQNYDKASTDLCSQQASDLKALSEDDPMAPLAYAHASLI
jgi:hypothetical protein